MPKDRWTITKLRKDEYDLQDARKRVLRGVDSRDIYAYVIKLDKRNPKVMFVLSDGSSNDGLRSRMSLMEALEYDW